ncbi:hypothetical protein J4E91_002202 [Alternaria rosae]|nr:hypothetical protein J4E91_002202 [Alternaria rosae]
MRFSLLRGGLIDFTIYGRRVGLAPRFALMAVSQKALAFLVKHPRAPAFNSTFDVPTVQLRGETGQVRLVTGKGKMREAQIKIHEAALVTISQWLTALCTPALVPLAGASFAIETCIRFICVHTLHAPEDNDRLLVGLAEKLIGEMLDGQLAAKQLNIFLCKAGNELLK